MPSLVQIFVVGGERKRRRVEGAAAAAFLSSALVVGAVSTTSTTTSAGEANNEQQDQESNNRGGRGGAPPAEFFQDYPAVVVPRRPDNRTSIRSRSITAWGGETNVLVHDQHMLAVRQQEQQRKAQEDFDSLFDHQHVFGIPQNPPLDLFSPIRNSKDNSPSEGIGEISTNNSTTNKQQRSNTNDAYFEERFNQLLRFKEEFGHCYVVRSYSENPALGQWCSGLRSIYNKIKNGVNKSSRILTNVRIERLEQIGFLWHDVYFEERFNQLLRFKEEFGHCNVVQSYSENPALGQWCSGLRSMYNKIKNGVNHYSRTLTKVRIERLEQIGFLWHVSYNDDGVFEDSCRQLIAFRDEFGHCNVPQKCKANPSLGTWCKVIRSAYSKLQNGLTNHSRALSQDRIARLEEIGFQWRCSMNVDSFDRRCCDLVDFKKEFGHCNVPINYPANQSLGTWCKALRTSYNKFQRGEKTNYNVSDDRIERLTKIGFRWQGAVASS